MPVKTKIPESKLLDKPQDMRRKPYKDIVIFSPVGDMAQLDGFAKHVKELGIDKEADFLFIYRQGLDYKDYGLSAVHLMEKMALGTSGAFYAGQVTSYEFGYGTIVVTDLDALIDSKKTFDEIVNLARKEKKGVCPLSTSQITNEDNRAYSFNHWGTFTREIFENYGFSIPYFIKGGEDYEFTCRYKTAGATILYENGTVFHPASGTTIYHKMLEKKKQYAYLPNLLKALVFVKRYEKNAILKYIFWYMNYAFFADAFDDKQLNKVLKGIKSFEIVKVEDDKTSQKIKITKIKDRGLFRSYSVVDNIGIIFSIFHLLIRKKYVVGTEQISLEMPRTELLIGIIKGIVLSPLRFIEAIDSANKFEKNTGDIYPPKPQSIKKAEDMLISVLKENKF